MAEGKGPIFILGCHRSGTSLLRSLLDGHPELNVVPVEGHYFEHRGYGVRYPMRSRKWTELRDEDGFIRAAREGLENYNRSSPSSRDASLEGRIDVQRFEEAMRELKIEDESSRIRTYYSSILRAMGKEPLEGGRWVEKSVEQIEFVPLIREHFPDARFIHILRNPYATFVSMRKFRQRDRAYPYLPPLVDTLYHHRSLFARWTSAFDRQSVISYEGLLKDPEGSMERICKELELSYSEQLLKPSSLGVEWQGNPSSGGSIPGLDAGRVDAWRTEIKPVEVLLVNRALGPLLELGGYERIPVPSGYWRKEKGERWKTWFSNRMYKNYWEK